MKDRNALFLLGRPFSPFYAFLMNIRSSMYRAGLFRVTRLNVPVISVGNITLGGTGKTPIVQYIARLLQSWGWNPAVVSRGYGGTSKEKINIVSEGGQPLLEASYIGDEPRLHAEVLNGIAVLTGPARRHPAQKALEIGADVVVLDDGFQHMALARNIDIVLFNTDKLAGNSRVFPGGDLREPVKALKRCDAFILTGTSERNSERAERFKDVLAQRFPDRPVFIAHYTPSDIVRYNSKGSPVLLGEEKKDVTVFHAFRGIAHPGNFEQTLEEMGINVAGFKAFPDHYPYCPDDIQELNRLAESAGANALITTEKDMVKLKELSSSIPVYVVRMEANIDSSFHDFLQGMLPDRSKATQ